MIGTWLVRLAFAGALFSSVAFYLTLRIKKAEWAKLARISFRASALFVIAAATLLLYLILTHQFQYTYVWSYSSTDLSIPLLVSTFYAGQEGSFLLWALYTAVIGVVLMDYARKRGYELQVMSIFALIQSALLLMIVVKNPFEFVWQSFPGQVSEGFIPANGRGLNPLLQNFWMVIHPPVLFTGFAAMSVPFAFAIAGLWKRDYQTWIRTAAPWTLFAALALGAGIMLGGYWAYETLGWGGYWGWDPVENSSFIPWLFAVAAVHVMLVQRRTGSYVRSTFLLSIIGFLLVLYSTFLTRSGVLGETSVHSFVEPGMGIYLLLVGMIVFFSALGIGWFLLRMKEMPKVPLHRSYLSREFALYVGAMVLIALAIYILVGTSSPLITGLVQSKPSAVDISYYAKGSQLLGIFLALLVGIGQLIWWQRSDPAVLLRSIAYPGVGALIVTIGLTPFGLRDVGIALIVFAAFFALFANLVVGFRIFRGNPRLAGGSIAHIGIALMLLGFIGSSRYDTKQTISLPQGEPVKALGYELTYIGYRETEHEKYAFDIKVQKDGRDFTLSPVMYYSEYNQGLMRNPDIAIRPTHDLYIEPQSLEQPRAMNPGSDVTLKKGESTKLGEYRVTFVDFDVDRSAMMAGGMPSVAARLSVSHGGKEEIVKPALRISKSGMERIPARCSDGSAEFQIVTMRPDENDPENSTVTLNVQIEDQGIASQPTKEVLIIEASIKPFVGFVWLGTLVVLGGLILSIARRSREARGH